MSNFPAQQDSFARISHGVNSTHPISLKYDRWSKTGPGMRDMHYEVELGIVCRGRMRREFEGGAMELGRDMIWTHGIWQPHSAFVTSAPLELLVMHISPSMLHGLTFSEGPKLNWLGPFTAAAAERPSGDIIPAAKIRQFAGELKSLDRDGKFFNIRLRLIVLQLLLCILEHWDGAGCSVAMEDSTLTRLERVLEMVFSGRHFVSVDEAAELAGMSRNGFNRFFARHMGLRFATFALHHRLSCAADELRTGRRTIKAIASDWGFTDLSHFYRRFGEVYGCTPVEYQSRIK